jgi:hypothetical protein
MAAGKSALSEGSSSPASRTDPMSSAVIGSLNFLPEPSM